MEAPITGEGDLKAEESSSRIRDLMRTTRVVLFVEKKTIGNENVLKEGDVQILQILQKSLSSH